VRLTHLLYDLRVALPRRLFYCMPANICVGCRPKDAGPDLPEAHCIRSWHQIWRAAPSGAGNRFRWTFCRLQSMENQSYYCRICAKNLWVRSPC